MTDNVSDVPKSERLARFVKHAHAIGSHVRAGKLSPDRASKVLWESARADNLIGEPDSTDEEIIGWEIDKAITSDEDEPRAAPNGHAAGEPPPPNGPDDYGAPIAPGPTNAKKPYKLTLARDITAEGTLKVFLIDGYLGRDEVSFWFGEPESGKSTVKIDAACHVAAGLPWCGRGVMRGAVLYVAAERGSLVKRRVLAWRLEHSKHDFPLAVIDDSVDLRTGKVDADRIIAAATELGKLSGHKVVWIIFDTLSRVLAGGDENSSKDMGLLVLSIDRIFRETGAHCSLVHHMPLNGGDRMRGHGLANGAGDTTVHVEKKDGVVTAAVDKCNDMADDEKPRVAFRFKSITVSEDPHRTASVMVQAEDQAAKPAAAAKTSRKARGETKAVMTFRDAVVEAIDSDGAIIQVRGDGPKVRAVDVQAVRAEFERRYATGEPDATKRADASRKAFKRTMAELPPQFATETRDSRELIWKVG